MPQITGIIPSPTTLTDLEREGLAESFGEYFVTSNNNKRRPSPPRRSSRNNKSGNNNNNISDNRTPKSNQHERQFSASIGRMESPLDVKDIDVHHGFVSVTRTTTVSPRGSSGQVDSSGVFGSHGSSTSIEEESSHDDNEDSDADADADASSDSHGGSSNNDGAGEESRHNLSKAYLLQAVMDGSNKAESANKRVTDKQARLKKLKHVLSTLASGVVEGDNKSPKKNNTSSSGATTGFTATELTQLSSLLNVNPQKKREVQKQLLKRQYSNPDIPQQRRSGGGGSISRHSSVVDNSVRTAPPARRGVQRTRSRSLTDLDRQNHIRGSYKKPEEEEEKEEDREERGEKNKGTEKNDEGKKEVAATEESSRRNRRPLLRNRSSSLSELDGRKKRGSKKTQDQEKGKKKSSNKRKTEKGANSPVVVAAVESSQRGAPSRRGVSRNRSSSLTELDRHKKRGGKKSDLGEDKKIDNKEKKPAATSAATDATEPSQRGRSGRRQLQRNRSSSLSELDGKKKRGGKKPQEQDDSENSNDNNKTNKPKHYALGPHFNFVEPKPRRRHSVGAASRQSSITSKQSSSIISKQSSVTSKQSSSIISKQSSESGNKADRSACSSSKQSDEQDNEDNTNSAHNRNSITSRENKADTKEGTNSKHRRISHRDYKRTESDNKERRTSNAKRISGGKLSKKDALGNKKEKETEQQRFKKDGEQRIKKDAVVEKRTSRLERRGDKKRVYDISKKPSSSNNNTSSSNRRSSTRTTHVRRSKSLGGDENIKRLGRSKRISEVVVQQHQESSSDHPAAQSLVRRSVGVAGGGAETMRRASSRDRRSSSRNPIDRNNSSSNNNNNNITGGDIPSRKSIRKSVSSGTPDTTAHTMPRRHRSHKTGSYGSLLVSSNPMPRSSTKLKQQAAVRATSLSESVPNFNYTFSPETPKKPDTNATVFGNKKHQVGRLLGYSNSMTTPNGGTSAGNNSESATNFHTSFTSLMLGEMDFDALSPPPTPHTPPRNKGRARGRRHSLR